MLNTGVKTVFDSSVIDTIYKEGVYPAQGTRPLFSTIDRLIKSKLSNVYYEIQNSENLVETIFFRSFEPYLLIEFFSANDTEQSLKIKLDLKLEKIKEEPNLDTRAVVSVHESGHAVLSIALNNSIPNAIYSTSSGFSGGMTVLDNRRGLFSKNMLLNKLAVSFGGIVAEKLIFGENNITLGSRSDLAGATRFVSNALMNQGFTDDIKGEYENSKLKVGLQSSEIENQIKDYLKEAEILAEQTLIENEELLVKLSEYLLNEDRVIKKEKISEFIDKYYRLTTEQVIEKSKELSYKTLLDNRISVVSQLELVD
jgi:cell division protease FtsH